MKVTLRVCECKLRICELSFIDPMYDNKGARRAIANISTMEGQNLYDLMTTDYALKVRFRYSGLKEEALA